MKTKLDDWEKATIVRYLEYHKKWDRIGIEDSYKNREMPEGLKKSLDETEDKFDILIKKIQEL